MTLTHILIFTAFGLLTGWFAPKRWRNNLLLAASLLAIYWIQPATPIRNLDFWFPTAAIALTVVIWMITLQKPVPIPTEPGTKPASSWISSLPNWSPNGTSMLVVFGSVALIGLTRYLEPLCCLTPSRPPEFYQVLFVLGLLGSAVILPARVAPRARFLPGIAILVILGLFVILKQAGLSLAVSAWLRSINGQNAALATPLDLRWLGFSYLAFRLLHVLRDYQAGRLPVFSLSEFVTYAIFFPAYTAGPIDRSQHFIAELRRPQADRSLDVVAGGQRILLGIFKKFVLADSLALFALSPKNFSQINSPIWMWVVLYAYAFRLYFDFSGYIDIALGLARMVGISLPENFDRPYLKTNLTAFWNSWHITLALWFRAYFFNPLTRAFRSQPRKLAIWAVILIGQVATMLLIGLWHGVAWNFAIWGIWHGIGLFIHNRWLVWFRPRQEALNQRPHLEGALRLSSWALTFHFVVLGWVWFALPDPAASWQVMLRLFGI